LFKSKMWLEQALAMNIKQMLHLSKFLRRAKNEECRTTIEGSRKR